MNELHHSRLATSVLLAMIALVCSSRTSWALDQSSENQSEQSAAKPDEPSEAKKASSDKRQAEDELEAIIVTGTFTPISKQQATTAVSTIDTAELEHLVPTTAVDVLSNVPGVFVDIS